MEEKYYTPKIEEFHVGFEYESYEMHYSMSDEWDEGTPMWIKRTVLDINQEQCDVNKPKYKATYHVAINNSYEPNVEWNKNIRVKYLDYKDIESLGWIDVWAEKKESRILSFVMIQQNGNYFELRYDTASSKCCTISIRTDLKPYELFIGRINNKSELVKIMKMVGINFNTNQI